MSLHGAAVAALRVWPAPDAGQERLRRDYLDHLGAHPDGVWRSAADHLTASALVLDHAGERTLLTLHRRARRWFQLGGHCEPGDVSLRAAAVREATEESGIAGLEVSAAPVRLDRHPAPCRAGGQHLDVQYLALAPAGAVAVLSGESLDLAWFPVGALPPPTDEALRALVDRAVAGLRPPTS